MGEIVPRQKDPTKKWHKLTIEHRVICNRDLIIPPETQRKLVIKSVHHDIHCGVAAPQKKDKIRSMVDKESKVIPMSKNL